MKKDSVWKNVSRNKVSYLFIAPYVILFFTFTALPVIISIFFSFTHFNLLEMPVFVGFENYIRLFLEDDIFIRAIGNTMIIALLTGPLGYLLCLLFAWLINELPRIWRTTLTIIFYAPSISGNLFMIWALFFSNDAHGLVNSYLIRFGFISQPVLWFQDTRYMMTLLVVITLWASIGTTFLAFIAGLQGIDPHLYEAGAMDGVRNRWQELWYITLPSMKPQLMFGAVMSITGAFGAGGIVTALFGFPSTEYAVHTIINHLEDYGGIRFEMGYASAIAVLLFILMIGANKSIQRMLSKVGE